LPDLVLAGGGLVAKAADEEARLERGCSWWRLLASDLGRAKNHF
jgi:hypothetical protein